jgi:hypothetical protein
VRTGPKIVAALVFSRPLKRVVQKICHPTLEEGRPTGLVVIETDILFRPEKQIEKRPVLPVYREANLSASESEADPSARGRSHTL